MAWHGTAWHIMLHQGSLAGITSEWHYLREMHLLSFILPYRLGRTYLFFPLFILYS